MLAKGLKEVCNQLSDYVQSDAEILSRVQQWRHENDLNFDDPQNDLTAELQGMGLEQHAELLAKLLVWIPSNMLVISPEPISKSLPRYFKAYLSSDRLKKRAYGLKKFTEIDPSLFARELVSTVLVSINSAKTDIKGAPMVVGIALPEFSNKRYMVTDYAYETTLENFPIEHHWKTVVQYALSISRSLKTIHDVGLAHLSLRPANILLHEGEAHIINLSHHAFDDSHLGDIKYFGPECYKERDYPRENPQATDIFALGWVLWQLTTRVEPRILPLVDEPWLVDELLPETPKEYADVIRDCWKEEPRDRPSISNVLHRLNQIDQSKLSSILDSK